jgi:hypothetical protein
MSDTPRTVEERITAYLSIGGLFNPELANHDAVRDLLIDARGELAESRKKAERLRRAMRDIARWTQEEQDMAVAGDYTILLWRGCVAIARAALKDDYSEEK